ncbi:MAG: CoA ester lyase [Epsilonproteobacteria bacterium]|nr:CoA ester lyase [Campylobacterota bacterium]
MIFDDLSRFEMMDEEALKEMIITSERTKADISSPRSAMMLNPLKLKHLNRIDNLATDIIVVNLEDGVAPQMKQKALLFAAVFISHLKASRSRVIVRVNPIDEGGEEEIALLNKVKPDVIRVAKIKTPEDVKRVLQVLDDDIGLHISIETKEALQNLTKLNVKGKVECCSLGIMDMLNSLGLPQSLLTFDNPTIHHILSRFLVDARIAGIYPIGFTYQEYEDLEGFTKWCEIEKQMGYSAKSCLGPKQVEIANRVFESDTQSYQRALEIKNIFEKKRAEGETGFMHERYGFIDEPIYKDALLILGQL